jgi:hypothetical protein
VSSVLFVLPAFDNNTVCGCWDEFTVGDGTSYNPYQITNANELNMTVCYLDSYFILMNDIDLSGCENWNGGEGWIPIGVEEDPFTGSFNGNNYTISNLFIDNTSGDFQGLFHTIDSGAIISNVILSDVNVSGKNYVGGLVARAGVTNLVYIINCSVSGEVAGRQRTGMLLGYSFGSVINCSVSGDVFGQGIDPVEHTGGLVGYPYDSIIENCYASVNVTGDDKVGGLVGENQGTISNCYATGDVTGNNCVGGLIGHNYNGILIDCTASGTVSYVTNGGWLIGCCNDCNGGLLINVFNETSGTPLTFDVSIFNNMGVLVYTAEDCTNTHWVNYTDMSPVAYTVSIIISSDDFNSRTYTGSLISNMYTTLNAYLAQGGNIYLVRVIDEYLYPIDNAVVSISKYVNYTGTWTVLSTFLTDGYGESFVTLIGDNDYKVNISKTGYNTNVFDWHTDPIYFGPGYPKTFKITHSFTGNVSYNFWDVISFTGTMYTNGTIKVTYIDSLTDTINATFKTYELYNGTSTLKSTNVTTNDNFVFWVHGINASRTHQVTLFLNHTILGYKVASITLLPVNNTGLNTTYIEDKIKDVFGDFDLGYVKFLFIYLPCIVIIVLGGTINTGLGVIGAGLWVGISSQFLSVPSGVVVLVPFIIVLGILLMIAKGGRIHL